MVKSEDRRLLIGLRRSKTLYSVIIIGRKADTSTQWLRLILLANRSGTSCATASALGKNDPFVLG
jgi:hypothetical protein